MEMDGWVNLEHCGVTTEYDGADEFLHFRVSHRFRISVKSCAESM